jgi:segregation and condensation protein A
MTEPPRSAEAEEPPSGGADAKAPSDPSGYRVELPTFEGPLDLLLHLIEEHELDIRDIPIAFVAKKYVEYITLMEQLNIDLASEYLVMAATLVHIKSKLLLPPAAQPEEEEPEPELDPRAELVRRLLEYQKYKHVAGELGAKDLLGRDVFRRGSPSVEVEGQRAIAGVSLFKLLDALQAVLARAKTAVEHAIDLDRLSITDRINQVTDLLRERGKLRFEELFEGRGTRGEIIVTFLALLEMTRLRLTRLYQDGPLDSIFVEMSVADEPGSVPPATVERSEEA